MSTHLPPGAVDVLTRALENSGNSPYAYLRMRYLGDPVLHAPTRLVETVDMPFVRQILLPTMHKEMANAWTPGVGLSANQIGSALRVAIARFGTVGPQGGKLPGEMVEMVNPQITEWSGKTMPCPQEGCLSVPHFRTSRVRDTWVVVAYKDANGEPHQRKVVGFDAQIVQHEIEHLDGAIFCGGSSRQQKRAAAREVAKYLEKQEKKR